jgi:hypothetical protein
MFEARYDFRHWPALDKDLVERVKRLKDHSKELKSSELGRANPFQLAATDIFVEKAQIHLTQRAKLNAYLGGALAFLCLLVVAAAVIGLAKVDGLRYVADWSHVVVFALRGAAIAGLVGGAVYFLASLSRAFFHESTTLFNRRHALRFGRMYIYLKYGESVDDRALLVDAIKSLGSQHAKDSAADPSQAPLASDAVAVGQPTVPPRYGSTYEHLVAYLIHRDVDAEELEKAFGWNLETYTGFRDIKPETMSASVYTKTIEVLGKMVESLAKVKSGKEPV